MGLSFVSPSPKEEAQQWYDGCDTVRRCYGNDETARVHHVQCRDFI